MLSAKQANNARAVIMAAVMFWRVRLLMGKWLYGVTCRDS